MRIIYIDDVFQGEMIREYRKKSGKTMERKRCFLNLLLFMLFSSRL